MNDADLGRYIVKVIKLSVICWAHINYDWQNRKYSQSVIIITVLFRSYFSLCKLNFFSYDVRNK